MTRLYTKSDADLSSPVTWAELSPKRKAEIVQNLHKSLDREQQEVRYLRMLLLSNGGRTAEEIDKLMWGLK